MPLRTIIIKGMHDRIAAEKVTRALQEVWGIDQVQVHADKGEATFNYDELAASFHDFQQAVLEMGFEIQTVDGKTIESLQDWQLDQEGGSANAARL
jgi:copper chaperone